MVTGSGGAGSSVGSTTGSSVGSTTGSSGAGDSVGSSVGVVQPTRLVMSMVRAIITVKSFHSLFFITFLLLH
ncbi:MAG: hypothetical protein DRJ03_04190 [Chloroflexi bacterium]|nr:MAG: hypothetical protein DRI81_01070 [Chloroflexota bacterium]RLC88003.1 MAG: hypothetical protein DRJ03_04190 [Chloroflexota bacterium]